MLCKRVCKQKLTFRRAGDFVDFILVSSCLFGMVACNQIFTIFGALERRLKFSDFQSYLGVIQDPESQHGSW